MMTGPDVDRRPVPYRSSRSNRSCHLFLDAIFSISPWRRRPAWRWHRHRRLPMPATSPSDVHQQLLDLAARQEERRRARFAAVTSKADLEALQTSLRKTFLGLLDGFPEKTGRPTGPEDRDDRSRRLRRREAGLRELPRLFRVGPALPAQDDRGPPAGRPQPVRPFDERQGRRRLPDPAHQPGEARLCRPDLRPGRPGRAEPVLGCEARPVALQPELRRARRAGQPALPPRHQPGPLPDLGRDAGPGLPDLAARGGPDRGSAAWATRAAARSRPTSRHSTRG